MTPQDTVLVIASPGVLGNDDDPDGDPITAVLADPPVHGTLTLHANGSFTYTPAAGYIGTDTFTYRAFDGYAYSGTAAVQIVVADPWQRYSFSYCVTTSGTENVTTYPDVAFSYRVTASGTETYPVYPLKYTSSICYWCNSNPPPIPGGWSLQGKTSLGDTVCGCDYAWYDYLYPSSIPGVPVGCPRPQDNTAANYYTIKGSTPSGSATQPVSISEIRTANVSRNDAVKDIGAIGLVPVPNRGGTVSGISYRVESLEPRVMVKFHDGATTSSETTNATATIVASTSYSEDGTVPWGPVTTCYTDDVYSTVWQEIRVLPTAPNPASTTWLIDETDPLVETMVDAGRLFARLLGPIPTLTITSTATPTPTLTSTPTPAAAFRFSPVSLRVPLDGTNTTTLYLEGLSTGLSGYNVTLSLADPVAGEIVNVSIPDWGLTANSTLPADRVWIQAVDTANVAGPGDAVLIGNITIRGDREGTTELDVTNAILDDDWGFDVVADPAFCPVTVLSLPYLPFIPSYPKDLDGDGKYEDVNGNGAKDFADIVLYFTYIESLKADDDALLFDYNGNGRIDFADVVWLFNHL